MIFLDVLFPGKNTVDVGAATRLMVVFLGSEGRGVTATGMAVAYSMLPVFNVTVSSLPVRFVKVLIAPIDLYLNHI